MNETRVNQRPSRFATAIAMILFSLAAASADETTAIPTVAQLDELPGRRVANMVPASALTEARLEWIRERIDATYDTDIENLQAELANVRESYRSLQNKGILLLAFGVFAGAFVSRVIR